MGRDMKLELIRFCYADFGVYGRFSLPSGMGLATVERPWLDNQRSVSCIPIGTYECRPRMYHRGGYPAIEVCDVPDRDYILFHIGNYVRNSRGCILVNSDISGGDVGLRGTGSRKAFNKFMEYFGQGFELEISNYQGGVLPST